MKNPLWPIRKKSRYLLHLSATLVFGGACIQGGAQSLPGERLGAGVESGPGRLSLGRDSGQDGAKAASEENGDPPGATVIRAFQKTVFDPKQNKVTFRGSVLVEDPRFVLKCDLLTAYVKKNAPVEKKQTTADSAASPAPGAGGDKAKSEAGRKAPETASPDEAKSSGGLESAEAEGNVEIIQERVTPEGKTERNVVRARRAVYSAATEGITLTGWPQVWQSHNGNSLKALREDTVMVLNKSGDVDITGPTKSVFVNPNKNGK